MMGKTEPGPKAGLTHQSPKYPKGNAEANDILVSLGYEPKLSRNRSTLQVAFMAFILASIPYGLSTTFYYPLIGGGTVNIIYGWVAVSVCILCLAASLGEITSVYPTAGGVYYQTFMLSPVRYRRLAAWICGWLYLVGNITITLAVTFGTTTFIVSCINVFQRDDGVAPFPGETYQVFLLFLGITILCNAIPAFGNRWLPMLDTAAIIWNVGGVIAICATVLSLAKQGRRSALEVFTHFEPSSGWANGWSFCIGLLQAGYATSATGMIISWCEEVQQPAIQVPKALLATVAFNFTIGLAFLISICFVLPDIQSIVAYNQPIPVILASATGSSVIGFILTIPLMVLGILCGVDCTTAASRCVWAFSRDGAVPGSGWLTIINTQLSIPLNAMAMSMVVQLVLGLIYFGSEAAFNAFSGVGVICLTTAYASPIVINLLTGRSKVHSAPFSLGTLGWVCNVVAVVWALFATPLFCIPTTIPVSVATVNYAPVVFCAAALVCSAWYWAWGATNYAGPPT